MNPDQYEDRKRYIDAVKSSFSASGQQMQATERKSDKTDSEKVLRSFLGVRFLLALCLSFAFFVIKQTDTSWKSWDADKITQKIQSTIDVSGMIEQLKELP